jgi:hypothetical protein
VSEPTPVAEALGPIEATALSLARRWNLVRADGTIKCAKCDYRTGTLPSLCCEACLAHKRGER